MIRPETKLGVEFDRAAAGAPRNVGRCAKIGTNDLRGVCPTKLRRWPLLAQKCILNQRELSTLGYKHAKLYPKTRACHDDPGGREAAFFVCSRADISRREKMKTKKASRKWLVFKDFYSGGRIRTSDLRVMSGFEAELTTR